MTRPPEFYRVRITEDNKVLWRGMTLTHVKDLPEEERNDVVNKIRGLKEQGFGRKKIQKELARSGVYVPEHIVRQAIAGEEIDWTIYWTRSGVKESYRDLEIREIVYKRVKELYNEGKSYRQIQEIIRQEFGLQLSKSHISYWCKGIHRPGGKEIELTPDVWLLIGLPVADG